MLTRYLKWVCLKMIIPTISHLTIVLYLGKCQDWWFHWCFFGSNKATCKHTPWWPHLSMFGQDKRNTTPTGMNQTCSHQGVNGSWSIAKSPNLTRQATNIRGLKRKTKPSAKRGKQNKYNLYYIYTCVYNMFQHTHNHTYMVPYIYIYCLKHTIIIIIILTMFIISKANYC